MQKIQLPLVAGRVKISQPTRAAEAKKYLEQRKTAEKANLRLQSLDRYAEFYRSADDSRSDLNTQDDGVVVLARGHEGARWSGAMSYDPSVTGAPLDGINLMEWDQSNGSTTIYTRDELGRGVMEERNREGDLLKRLTINGDDTLTFEQFS